MSWILYQTNVLLAMATFRFADDPDGIAEFISKEYDSCIKRGGVGNHARCHACARVAAYRAVACGVASVHYPRPSCGRATARHLARADGSQRVDEYADD